MPLLSDLPINQSVGYFKLAGAEIIDDGYEPEPYVWIQYSTIEPIKSYGPLYLELGSMSLEGGRVTACRSYQCSVTNTAYPIMQITYCAIAYTPKQRLRAKLLSKKVALEVFERIVESRPAEEVAAIKKAAAKAGKLLRDEISEADYFRYVKRKLITAQGESGKKYIIPRTGRIRVLENNKPIATLCIHSDKACPLDDHVINMKTLIETDENLFWSLANIRNM